MDKLKAVGAHLRPEPTPRGLQAARSWCEHGIAHVDISGVTSVWELFRAVMRNTINEDLAQAGPGPRELPRWS